MTPRFKLFLFQCLNILLFTINAYIGLIQPTLTRGLIIIGIGLAIYEVLTVIYLKKSFKLDKIKLDKIRN